MAKVLARWSAASVASRYINVHAKRIFLVGAIALSPFDVASYPDFLIKELIPYHNMMWMRKENDLQLIQSVQEPRVSAKDDADSDIRCAFYELQGTCFAPTEYCVSPWNINGQNGIALAGLAAHVLGKILCPDEMHTARLTLDILGVVPRVPLEARTRVLRQGRRVQLVEADLRANDRTYVRATALKTRIATSPQTCQPLAHPLPDTAKAGAAVPWVKIHLLEGGFTQIGPGAQWVRFLTDVVKGFPLSPLERVAMVSDFGSGAAPLVSPKDWTFANLDIAAHMTRLPEGEWLLIDVTSESSGNGIGVVHTRLGDIDGMFGHAHQTVFLDPRSVP